jgi:hypothetical protein
LPRSDEIAEGGGTVRKVLLVTGIGLAGSAVYAAAIGMIYELERESHYAAWRQSPPVSAPISGSADRAVTPVEMSGSTELRAAS